MKTKEEKKETLQNAIEQGKEYGYISWDGLIEYFIDNMVNQEKYLKADPTTQKMLDLCDKDMVIGRYIIKELKKMKDANVIDFDIDDLTD